MKTELLIDGLKYSLTYRARFVLRNVASATLYTADENRSALKGAEEGKGCRRKGMRGGKRGRRLLYIGETKFRVELPRTTQLDEIPAPSLQTQLYDTVFLVSKVERATPRWRSVCVPGIGSCLLIRTSHVVGDILIRRRIKEFRSRVGGEGEKGLDLF